MVSKDFAGGFGVGNHPGTGGLRGWIIRRFFTRDRRPVALTFAYLAAIFKKLGHTVVYAEDRIPLGSDLYVFCPSLMTLEVERRMIVEMLGKNPTARVFIVGTVASVMPEAFADLGATVIKGEPEQLLWKLDEVLARPHATVQLGVIDNLDRLPPPDWSPFDPRKFRIGYDFWKFPTAYLQASRGCSFRCNYCPYTLLDNSTRHRDPDSVVEEIARGINLWGFRSFKFRDPLFGLDRARVLRLADLIGKLPRRIQFSIETRIELVPLDLLHLLKKAGLTSITIGIETPDDATLKSRGRSNASGDRQREFIENCRQLDIRTVAGFLIGFPEDTEESIRAVARYARSLNPTYANFNVVTPYPGTEFSENEKANGRIADFDFARYSSYAPVMKYERLAPADIERLHAKAFNHFFFRWDYLRANASLLWPALRRFGLGGKTPEPATIPMTDETTHPGVPHPKGGLEILKRKGLRPDGPHLRPKSTDQRKE
jgi:radical SAM superfamily enzyme YgiQ (UPF0313 family)